jgi:hypothetical protein
VIGDWVKILATKPDEQGCGKRATTLPVSSFEQKVAKVT